MALHQNNSLIADVPEGWQVCRVCGQLIESVKMPFDECPGVEVSGREV
jgi:hypothetical protein